MTKLLKGELMQQDLACNKVLDLACYVLISGSGNTAESGNFLVMFLSVFKLSTALKGR